MFEVSEQVIYEFIDGETLLLDLATSRYFKLDEVATTAFRLLTTQPDRDRVDQELLDVYEVEADRLRSDMDRLIGTLLHEGLIRPTARTSP